MRTTMGLNVVRAFRPAGASGPKGPHYLAGSFSTVKIAAESCLAPPRR
jgi:hypothetical protein